MVLAREFLKCTSIVSPTRIRIQDQACDTFVPNARAAQGPRKLEASPNLPQL